MQEKFRLTVPPTRNSSLTDLSLPLSFSLSSSLSLLSASRYAYGWASVHPTRKLFFNLFLTGMSAAIALSVGAVEVLSLLEQQFDLPGPFFAAVAEVNDHFELVGFGIIAFFALGTLAAVLLYKFAVEPAIPPTMGSGGGGGATELARLVDNKRPAATAAAAGGGDYLQRRIAELARTPISQISVRDI